MNVYDPTSGGIKRTDAKAYAPKVYLCSRTHSPHILHIAHVNSSLSPDKYLRMACARAAATLPTSTPLRSSFTTAAASLPSRPCAVSVVVVSFIVASLMSVSAAAIETVAAGPVTAVLLPLSIAAFCTLLIECGLSSPRGLLKTAPPAVRMKR